MNLTFHSEHGEDRWIHEHVKGLPANGVYVDIGCAHPVDSSNTAFLREMGWIGVAIDANPQWAQDWKNEGCEEDFVCEVISNAPTARWRVNPFGHPYASRIDKNAPEMPAVEIESILGNRKIGKINILSIDTEGHDYYILGTLNFSLHEPSIIIAEYMTAELGPDYRAKKLLESIGYQLVHQTISNFIFWNPK